ncbi:MAG: hypothetical protein AB1768_09190 [Pseudomonadota bacterium]|jgi:hypothetical protein
MKPVTAEAVDEDERLAALAAPEVAQPAPGDLDLLRPRPGVLLLAARGEAGGELGHRRIDLGLRHLGIGHDAQQPAHRHGKAPTWAW